MALLRLIQSLDEVPEAFREHYVEIEGGDGFQLDTDDAEYKKKLDEFRSNNRKLKKEMDRLQGQMDRYKDIDPDKWEEAKEALETLEKLQEKDLLKDGNLDEIVAKRTESMKKDFDKAIKAKDEALSTTSQQAKTYRQKLEDLQLDSMAMTAAGKVGTIRQGAIDDIKSRFRRDWVIDEDGDPVAKRAGEALFGKDTNPLTAEEWATNLLNDAPHLFEGSKGGGAEGGRESRKPTTEKVVDRKDVKSFGDNLAGIASGEVKVR